MPSPAPDAPAAQHPSADGLAIRWGVVTNYLDDGGRFRSRLALVNRGDVALPAEGWTLYFNFLRDIDSESLPPSVRLTRVNGDFYRLEPTERFAPLQPGEERVLSFEAGGSVIKEIDAPAGFYFVFGGEAPAPVSDVTVEPFTSPLQTDRGPNDAVPVPNPASRYRANEVLEPLPDEEVGRLTPTSVSMGRGAGQFQLDRTVSIYHEPELAGEAAFLAAALEPLLGIQLETAEGALDEAPAIVLRQGRVPEIEEALPGSESYRLMIDSTGIEIVGTDAAGVFYGIQSLRALLPVEAYQQPGESVDVPAVTVSDAPRFGYRGLHLDVSRNFQTADDVKRLLDVMAFYKLNTFHFHLTDDEGWRLAIEGLPELTEVGGRRGHTTDERDHLIPSYGSGPNPDPEASHGSGWYSREEYIDILRHARERHIEVIPEIDVPGHARAAIKAMEARHRQLSAEGEEAASEYRLVHPDDQSEYESVQNWDDNVIDVCQSSTYRFLETVIDDIQAMHDEAEVPLTTIHIGGDEVPHGAWTASPACEGLIQENADLESADDLFAYFMRRMEEILSERDLTMAGWEEVALEEHEEETTKTPYPAFAERDVRPHVWSNIWGSGTEDYAYQLANAGYEVVMSHASNLYFDMAYNKHPQEAGYYWASFIDDAGPFNFVPLDLYKSAEVSQMGHPIDPEAFAEAEQLTAEGRKNILGLQGQLWSETLRGADRMEYMAVPRLISLAERAWAPQPDWAIIDEVPERMGERLAAWNEFAHRLGQRELPRLGALDPEWTYRLPVPGAIIENGQLQANTALPGLTIRYTADGSEPTASSPEYTEPVSVEDAEVVKLRTFDANGRGSRTATIER